MWQVRDPPLYTPIRRIRIESTSFLAVPQAVITKAEEVEALAAAEAEGKKENSAAVV